MLNFKDNFLPIIGNSNACASIVDTICGHLSIFMWKTQPKCCRNTLMSLSAVRDILVVF